MRERDATDTYLKTNRELWHRWSRQHETSPLYAVPAVKAFGAHVTGTDLSPASIAVARTLSQELNLAAEVVRKDPR